MATLQQQNVSTLRDFLEAIEAQTNDPADPVWFRGVGDASQPLLPSLYRHPTHKAKSPLLDLERTMLVRFKERSLPYLASPLSTNWEYLFLMQHHGVPTRLLDWTENPMVALFFALTSARKPPGNPNYSVPAAVWALSPRLWNAKVFSHVSYSGGAISVSERIVASYEPLQPEKSEPPAYPAAIFGIHNSPRIVAQRGVFTIFGSELRPMEDVFAGEKFDDRALTKVVIPVPAIDPLLRKLMATGHTDSVIFPSLDGLAREMKRLYGYEGQ